MSRIQNLAAANIILALLHRLLINQIDRPPEDYLQLLLHYVQLPKGVGYLWGKGNKHIDVALFLETFIQDRAKKRKFLNVPTLAKFSYFFP